MFQNIRRIQNKIGDGERGSRGRDRQIIIAGMSRKFQSQVISSGFRRIFIHFLLITNTSVDNSPSKTLGTHTRTHSLEWSVQLAAFESYKNMQLIHWLQNMCTCVTLHFVWQCVQSSFSVHCCRSRCAVAAVADWLPHSIHAKHCSIVSIVKSKVIYILKYDFTAKPNTSGELKNKKSPDNRRWSGAAGHSYFLVVAPIFCSAEFDCPFRFGASLRWWMYSFFSFRSWTCSVSNENQKYQSDFPSTLFSHYQTARSILGRGFS